MNTKDIPMHNFSELDFKEISIKRIRNEILKNSDWTQSADSPLSTEKRLEWATYRQALRDLTSQEKFPLEISWPVAPL